MTTAIEFDPQRSLAAHITPIADAQLVAHVPVERRTAQIIAGVLDAQNQPVEASICWRSQGHAKTILPQPKDALNQPAGAHMAGRWLFGGVLYSHFGHFLCESTARLWALDHVGDIDGVVFIPKRQMTHPRRAIMPVRSWLDILGLADVPVMATGRERLRFDELLMAPQGFGTGTMIAGAPEFRKFMRDGLDQKIQPDGPAKIYISRSKLFSKRGRYLGETALEALLQAQGYEIFHPQLHDLTTQMARYKAADMILSSDNSALHLAAFLLKPTARVGIIKRRPGAIIDDFVTQLSWNAAISADILDVLAPHHFRFGAGRRNMNEVYTELNLPKLHQLLLDKGYISPSPPWPALSNDQLDAECADLSDKLGADVHKALF